MKIDQKEYKQILAFQYWFVMWRVEGQDLKTLRESKIPSESELEDWISKNPTLLGEELLVIGRQVTVEGVKDRLDLLAIDSNLNAVVIEIKKGEVRGGADIQSLKYASYISNWSYDQFREIAESYFKDNKIDKTFANALQEFAEEDIDYEDINRRQRIILVGTDFDPKIVSVARWLADQGVPIKLVKISAWTDGKNTFLKSDVVLQPAEPTIQPAVGKGRPWLEDGESWHLKQRCNRQTATKLQELVEYLTSLEGVRVSWNQEFYVAFILAERNWITVGTFPNQLNIRIRVEPGRFKKEEIVKTLNIEEEKIDIEHRGTHDRIIVKIGPDFNIQDNSFRQLIETSHESFLKIV